MRIRIHRGANEVGGNCVEVEAADGSRIVLDLGRPLDATPTEAVDLPVFDGPVLGVLISHPHLDHYGLVADLSVDVPIYIGREAAAVLTAAAFFSPITFAIEPAGHLRDREPFELGPFVITPYLVDHSAFDSYSLLVEVDGKRLFYTGDFRAHGRKASLFEKLVADPPQPIDVLITEGTHLSGERSDEPTTEGDLERRLTKVCLDTSGAVAMLGSAQNLDRVVTAYRAARRSGRTLVTDLYTATVAAATRTTIPQPGFDAYRVFVPQRQRVLVKDSGQFERIARIRESRIFAQELAAHPERYLLYVPSSTSHELLRPGVIGSTSRVLWSMWDGYLDEPSGLRLTASLAAAGIPFDSLHTSGHASVGDVGRLIDALAPRQVVPIHTDAPQQLVANFDRAIAHDDGTWWAA